MTAARLRLTAALAASLLAALAAAPTAPAAAQEAVDREIVESQRRLEQIRREREELQSELGRLRGRVSDLSGEVQLIEREVSASAELLGELEFQLAQREAQIERNTYELLMARDRLTERRAVLNRRLRDIYKRGPLASVEVLLAAESFADLLNRYRYLFLVAGHDRRLAEEVVELERQLVARERALRSNRLQLEAMRGEREREHGQLTGLGATQRQVLTSVQARERTAAERIDQLARDEASLASLLATLESRRRAGERGGPAGAAPVPASLTPRSMGTLDWPVEGALVYGFGRTSPSAGAVVRRNGVGLGAAAGTPVRAVEAGEVVLAGSFEGYGPTVILSHGLGYYTLYLHLREVQVAEGEAVSRGQPVGTVGGEDAPGGPLVEFQLRVPGGEAVDPLLWLRPRSP